MTQRQNQYSFTSTNYLEIHKEGNSPHLSHVFTDLSQHLNVNGFINILFLEYLCPEALCMVSSAVSSLPPLCQCAESVWSARDIHENPQSPSGIQTLLCSCPLDWHIGRNPFQILHMWNLVLCPIQPAAS